MKKLLAWFILSIFVALYAVSNNDYLMHAITSRRYKFTSIWGTDRLHYGDLYGFSYLHGFKFPLRLEDSMGAGKGIGSIAACPAGMPTDINLYCICDSYLFLFVTGEHDFCRVNKYAYIRDYDNGRLNIVFDTTRRNVLLIEITERMVRDALGDTPYLNRRLIVDGTDSQRFIPDANDYRKKLVSNFFNNDINTNLEFNLFDYTLLTPFKEAKAWINDKIFGRVDRYVAVSSDRTRLYLGSTVDSTGDNHYSSFGTVTDDDIATYVRTLNKLQEKFRKMGFDYIYFCGIPNPGTVCEAGHSKYNGLLPRLQNDSNLRMPVIDVYSSFMVYQPYSIYRRSDSHWNARGFIEWRDQFNRILDTIPAYRRPR